MCELLGMSANVPTDICFSFTGLMHRGGRTGPHRDGWGIAFYEGKDGRGFREFRDPQASCDSEIARLVRGYPIKSRIVISHVRQANVGRVCLENTHPFFRELWGRFWSFAHNGQLKGIRDQGLGVYRPVGTTDSEHAFCWMLDRIRKRFESPPRLARTLWGEIRRLCDQLSDLGVFNLLLTDSRHLYAYCSTNLAWITRRAPFGRAQLCDADLAVDFTSETTPGDVVTVIATRPLTADEAWQPMGPGDFFVFRDGLPVWSSREGTSTRGRERPG